MEGRGRQEEREKMEGERKQREMREKGRGYY